MSTFSEIRQALESEIANVSGIPNADNRAWENVQFTPTTGTAWVRMTLLPGEVRPASAGSNPALRYQGIFQIDVYESEGNGPNSADTLADNIRSSYQVIDSFTAGSTTVRIRWSERSPGQSEPPWYRVSVTVSWYVYE